MIHIIAFSFNRAMQLDTLLSSLLEHWKSPDFYVDVVYNYSSKDFGAGYELLKKNYQGKPVTLHREEISNADSVQIVDLFRINNLVRLWRNPKHRRPKTNFRTIIIDLIENRGAENILFLTDDSMFVSDITLTSKEIKWINNAPQKNQFSLRLGKGVSSLPPTISIDGEYCKWNMYENTGNWGYPFSVDAHIYNTSVLLKLLKRYLFIHPSSLEGNICSVVRRAKLFPNGRCFADIKMLTFPINIVQDAVDNVSQDVSVEMLNKRYLAGDRLKYVVDERFDATKQYVHQIEYTDKNGNTSLVSISDELIHPNK